MMNYGHKTILPTNEYYGPVLVRGLALVNCLGGSSWETWMSTSHFIAV